jgi:hypothetical protein
VAAEARRREGVLAPEGTLFNRHGQRLSAHKQAVFATACATLGALFAGEVLDLALLGFSDASTFGGDLPSAVKTMA